jgi:DNA repair exonuclease SbcCD ATPase subunit
MAKGKRAGHTHSLKNVRPPTLVRQSSGERLLAQSELDQLQERRDTLMAQVDEIDSEILAYKKKRQGELLAELEGLGLNMPGARSAVGAGGEKKITRVRDTSKPCPICGELGHDGRKHRNDRSKFRAVGKSTDEEDDALPVDA